VAHLSFPKENPDIFAPQIKRGAEANKPKYPSPCDNSELAADRMVCEFGHMSIVEAGQLPPARYYEMLFAAATQAEAAPLIQKRLAAEAEQEAKHRDAARLPGR